MKKNWIPKRKGNIYCSSACGRGCTIHEYNNAVNEAKKIIKILGKGWIFNIHENLGWFYYIRFNFDETNYISVSRSFTDMYSAQFNSSDMFCYSKDPQKAVSNLIVLMKIRFYT